MTDLDDDDNEAAALVESELIDAARCLIEEHDYSREDIEGILKGTVFPKLAEGERVTVVAKFELDEAITSEENANVVIRQVADRLGDTRRELREALEQASQRGERPIGENLKRHIVWLCAGCEECEPTDGSEPVNHPCADSPSMNGAVVVLAEDYDQVVEQRDYARGCLGASSRNEVKFCGEAGSYRRRAIELEKALGIARDDLFKAANQFAGLMPEGENQHIFTKKAEQASAALR